MDRGKALASLAKQLRGLRPTWSSIREPHTLWLHSAEHRGGADALARTVTFLTKELDELASDKPSLPFVRVRLVCAYNNQMLGYSNTSSRIFLFSW